MREAELELLDPAMSVAATTLSSSTTTTSSTKSSKRKRSKGMDLAESAEVGMYVCTYVCMCWQSVRSIDRSIGRLISLSFCHRIATVARLAAS